MPRRPTFSPHRSTANGNPDDWQAAGEVDFWGTSFYPKHSFPVGRDAAWRGALLDFTRSSTIGKSNGFWIGELQGGFGTVALRVGATVTAADLRMWMWSALARGAKSISVYAWYPMSSGYESGGFGLIDLDGTITGRARAAGAVARTVSANSTLFLQAHPPAAEVAIVYDPLSYMVGGRQAFSPSSAQSETASIERSSMLGYYRALFPTNLTVDFIHINDINKRDYKLIIVPYPLMIPRSAAAAMREYVRNGGSLVAEARLAWNDERGKANGIIPGFGLNEVCGCREAAVQQTATGKAEVQLANGDHFDGRLYEETLGVAAGASPAARVIAHFAGGGPAIVTRDYGKGRIMIIGTFLGTSYDRDHDEALGRFLRSLLGWAGVAEPPAEAPGVEIRMLESGSDRIVFAFNHSDAAASVTLPGVNLETGEPVDQTTLAPHAVLVVKRTTRRTSAP